MSTLPATAAKPGLPAGKSGLPARQPRLRRGDHEFLPAALEILETPLSPVRSTMIVTICAFAAAALVWSYVGRVDIIAVAQGKIQPVGRTKTIQPLETGKILKLLVGNGEVVKAGQVLAELDPAEAEADAATLRTDLYARKAEAIRRRLAIDAATKRVSNIHLPIDWSGVPAVYAQREQRVLTDDLGQLSSTAASLEAQRGEKVAERDRLKATIAAQQQLLAILKQRVDMRVELFGRKAESKASVIDAEEVYQTQATTLANQQGQLTEAEAGIARGARDIDKTYASFIAENAQKLAEADRQAGEDTEKLAKAEIKVGHMVLTSPIMGTVQGLTVTTLGQVVQSGEQIMQVVPERAALEIESYLPNADIAFVKPGQQAVVKIESFPFTDYGTLSATVTRVAQDAIPLPDADQREQNPIQSKKSEMFGGGQRTQNLVFPVTLKLDRTVVKANGAEVPLGPGMAVTVEVRTGTRRILSYIFSPLIEVTSGAFKER